MNLQDLRQRLDPRLAMNRRCRVLGHAWHVTSAEPYHFAPMQEDPRYVDRHFTLAYKRCNHCDAIDMFLVQGLHRLHQLTPKVLRRYTVRRTFDRVPG